MRYWLGRNGGADFDDKHWIFKSVRELVEHFGFSESSVRRNLKKLLDLGWLVREKKKAHKWDHTYWWTFGVTDPFKRVQGTSAAVQSQPSSTPQTSEISLSQTRPNPSGQNEHIEVVKKNESKYKTRLPEQKLPRRTSAKTEQPELTRQQMEHFQALEEQRKLMTPEELAAGPAAARAMFDKHSHKQPTAVNKERILQQSPSAPVETQTTMRVPATGSASYSRTASEIKSSAVTSKGSTSGLSPFFSRVASALTGLDS